MRLSLQTACVCVCADAAKQQVVRDDEDSRVQLNAKLRSWLATPEPDISFADGEPAQLLI